MKNRLQLLFAVIAMLCTIYWLQSCDGAGFSSDTEEASGLVGDDNGSSDDGDEIGESLADDDDTEQSAAKALTDEEKQAELTTILNTPAKMKNRKVKVCMTYVSNKDHYCEKTQYHVYFNPKNTTNLAEWISDNTHANNVLNLNNGKCRFVTLISGKQFKIGKDCSYTEQEQADIDSYLGSGAYNTHMKNTHRRHVPGVIYNEAKWDENGNLKIQTRCALDKCEHESAEIISISMIGTVKFSDGSKKYLSKELVPLELQKLALYDNNGKKVTKNVSEYTYNFKSFTFADQEPSFDDFCGIVTK